MQATFPRNPNKGPTLSQKLGYFLLPPLVTLVFLTLLAAFIVGRYQASHRDRVYTGVRVGDVDLSGMTAEEAQDALLAAYPYAHGGEIRLTEPQSGRQWSFAPAQLGIELDTGASVESAMAIGRSGGPLQQLRDTFDSWYFGRALTPVMVFDEGQLQGSVSALALEVDQAAVDATISYENAEATFNPGRTGQQLDTADLRQRLVTPILALQDAEIELLVHEIAPAQYDDQELALTLQRAVEGPMTFYLAEPLDDLDLPPVTLSRETLASWLFVDSQTAGDGSLQQEIVVDENAVRHWLRQFEAPLQREPVNARFYFDDDTRELVPVARHINGRSLDIEATIEQFVAQVGTNNRSVPFVVQEFVPDVNSDSTAAELGITGLIDETTTWFYGSSDARKHNIARSAANFFGVIVAPGEEFSFNKYLGSISEADGYEQGLIIVGGQTINGIGGGVCQVSTTLYQSAFLAGFPITERTEHGYMLHYYDDGEGPGMDATVYSPIVDTKFINDTPHYLLLENYYNEEFEALTFKIYSTDIGREVVKTEPVFSNVVPAPEDDRWEFDPDLPPGTVEQIDVAVEGADVSLQRTVYDENGDIVLDETVTSHYIPYPNVYRYGPGVEPYDYTLVPDNS